MLRQVAVAVTVAVEVAASGQAPQTLDSKTCDLLPILSLGCFFQELPGNIIKS